MTEVTKVRLRFAKCGDLRLVSHRDIMRCLERMLRRARIPIALTQGFNPRPKMTFALALGLGIEGRREVVDLELSEPIESSVLLLRLKPVAPPGFNWLDAHPLPANAPPPRPRTVEYTFPVLDERRLTAQSNLQMFLSSDRWPVIAAQAQSRVDLRFASRGDCRRAHQRRTAAISFERIRRWLRPSRRAARCTRPSRPARPGSRPDSNRCGTRIPQPNTGTDQSVPVLKRDRMKKEMLINVLQPEECRIAIIEDGVLEELYVERTSHESYTGNIYKGRIVNLEPAIQAAFVDFSVGRNGFLHVSDVEPQYFERIEGTHDESEPGMRERDRDRKRDPRRGRGRDDRRGSPPRPESLGPPPGGVPPAAPPRLDDRSARTRTGTRS